MVWEDLKPRTSSTAGVASTTPSRRCSRSAARPTRIVHLIAMARRAGVALDLDRFDALARKTPVLANLRPAGKYLMEDFFYAGGLRALLRGWAT